MSSYYQILSNLKNANWLRCSPYWFDYFYHFTDLKNAAGILEEGKLYSRNEAIKKKLMKCDNAEQQVLKQNENVTNFARLYFRPRTPTQWRNEGFRKRNYEYSAHCPIPIFFLFDSKILTEKRDFHFTNGNLARRRTQVLNTLPQFKNLDFEKIYHEGSIYEPFENEEITYHRNAEILFPKSLEIESSLKWICCRSDAERFTFLNHLSPDLKVKWNNIVRVAKGTFPFFKNWLFIKEVFMESNQVTIKFNFGNKVKNDWKYEISLKIESNELNSPRIFQRTLKQNPLDDSRYFNFQKNNLPNLSSYKIEILIDDILAFTDNYDSKINELPY